MRALRFAFLIIAAVLACLLLAGCQRVIRTPADELVMNRWGTVTENGNRLELSFEEDEAAFSAKNDDFTLTVSGLYEADDASLTINDSVTHLDYRFSYRLYGDRIELTYGDGTVVLEKK